MKKLFKYRNIKYLILIVFFVIAIIAVSIYNNIKSPDLFWSFNIANCFTLLVALFFSYFFTQKLTDDRKKQDIIDNIIVELKKDLDDDDLYIITEKTDQDILRAKIRRIQNNIDLLIKIKINSISNQDINYISEQFTTYNEMLDNDIDYLKKSQKYLKRFLDLINSKLNQIRIDLYELNK